MRTQHGRWRKFYAGTSVIWHFRRALRFRCECVNGQQVLLASWCNGIWWSNNPSRYTGSHLHDDRHDWQPRCRLSQLGRKLGRGLRSAQPPVGHPTRPRTERHPGQGHHQATLPTSLLWRGAVPIWQVSVS